MESISLLSKGLSFVDWSVPFMMSSAGSSDSKFPFIIPHLKFKRSVFPPERVILSYAQPPAHVLHVTYSKCLFVNSAATSVYVCTPFGNFLDQSGHSWNESKKK